MKKLMHAMLAASLLAWPASALAEDIGPTARGMFAMLPASVFESTPAGLSESDKRELLLTGKSEFWEIAGETANAMIFASLPFRDRAVALRLFRNDREGGADVAIGTLGEPICTVEIWRLDSAGRLKPVDVPQEPEIGEFFRKGKKIPRRVKHATQICLGAGALVARPLFWNKYGMLQAKVDNEISYRWTGSGFEKITRPAPGEAATEDALSPEEALALE